MAVGAKEDLRRDPSETDFRNQHYIIICFTLYFRGDQFWLSGRDVPAFLTWFSTTFLKIVVEDTTSGLLLVCKLRFGESKGMLPVKDIASNIQMAVNYCGHQLARRFRWVASAYQKKEGATLHPEACKYSLQYDGRPGGALVCGFGHGI